MRRRLDVGVWTRVAVPNAERQLQNTLHDLSAARYQALFSCLQSKALAGVLREDNPTPCWRRDGAPACP